MNRFIKTMIIGWAFALIVETINMGIGQGLWTGMVLTVLLFYGAFIAAGYWLVERYDIPPLRHLLIFGTLGLMAEWVIFGMVPWGGGNFIVMLLIQTGMFSHWATTTFGPRFLLDEDPRFKCLKRSFLAFFGISMGLVFALGAISPTKGRWTLMILGNVIVYSILLLWYVKYIRIDRSA